MNAILQISGCCQRYRAQLILRPGVDAVITIDAIGKTEGEARALALQTAAGFPGFDPAAVKRR